jgi:hypothetical protein
MFLICTAQSKFHPGLKIITIHNLICWYFTQTLFIVAVSIVSNFCLFDHIVFARSLGLNPPYEGFKKIVIEHTSKKNLIQYFTSTYITCGPLGDGNRNGEQG